MSGKRFDWERTTQREIARVSSELVDMARSLPTATLHEAAGKIGALPHGIKPVAPSFRVCGPAVTVHGPGGDNLWLHRALYAAQRGDVLVVNVSGAEAHGYWGEIMSTAAQVLGLEGLIIDGCVRDGLLLKEIGFPVFARGLCIRGTGKDPGAAGWINAPTLLGDVTVMPGDLVVGDGDGVVCIPASRVREVIASSQQREKDEARAIERLRAGESSLSIFGWN